MTIPNRTVSIKSVFASTANTTIPTPPAPGVSYRNTGTTAAEIGEGWPFKKVVDSAKFNQAMYEYTTICQQLEKYGFLPWSANTDYPAQGCALGSDGKVYQAKQATGPSSTSIDPTTDTSHTYWDLFYYADVTANRALVSNANGKMAASSVTATELGYVHGVTSAVQTQINSKAADNTVVHKTGYETIDGEKNFTSNLARVNTNFTKGTNPSTTYYNAVEFTDKNGIGNTNRVGMLETSIAANGLISTYITAYKYANNSTNNARIAVIYPTSGNPYTEAPASDVNGSIVTTVNKSKAANGYFQLGNGLIIQWGRTKVSIITGASHTPITTITFPKAFTTTNYSLTGTFENNTSTSPSNTDDVSLCTKAIYTTSADVFGYDAGGNTYNAYLRWIAIGY